MKKFSVTCGMLMIAATTAVGCADNAETSTRLNAPPIVRPVESTETSPQSFSVRGFLSNEGTGSIAQGLGGKDLVQNATTVTIARLNEKGQLEEVGSAEVKEGKFDIKLSPGDAGGILILQAKNLVGAVLGSAVLNGIPAFLKGFLTDVPIDTITSFKTEILLTLAKGGVPGIQNFLNVINTFVDSELAGIIAVTGAFSTDFNTILGAVADAIVATENIIIATLQAAGLPVDLTNLIEAQLALVGGIQDFVTTTNGKLVTAAKNLIAALQEATAKAVAPVDKAIYNAIIAGSAMFNSVLKNLLPQQTGTLGGSANIADTLFAVFKSTFKLQNEISLESIGNALGLTALDSQIAEMIRNAGGALLQAIADATSMKALADAKAAFDNVLLGKKGNPIGNIVDVLASVVQNIQNALNALAAILDPLKKNLATQLSGFPLTDASIGDALAKFDTGAKDLANQLKNSMSAADAEALAESIRMASKVFVP